jgi:hypothetical protein
MRAIFTTQGPVVLGALCNDGECDHDLPEVARVFVARYEEATDSWSEAPAGTVPDAERFAEGTLGIGTLGPDAYFAVGHETWRVSEANDVDVVPSPGGTVYRICLSGTNVQAVTRPGPSTGDESVGTPPLADLLIVERPAADTHAAWRTDSPFAHVDPAVAAGSVMLGAVCGDEGPVLVAEGRYVALVDGTWRAIGADNDASAVGDWSPVPGRGVVIDLPTRLALVGDTDVRYHDLDLPAGLPPLRALEAVGDRIVCYLHFQDGSYTMSYVNF